MKAKLIFVLLVLNAIVGKTQNKNPAALAYSFIKSVTVQDSVIFYNCIDKSTLKANIDKRYGLDKKIKENELHVLYFLKFSPWEIKPEELDKIASEFEEKSKFFLKIDQESNDGLLLYVEWNDKYKLILHLMKIASEWKICNIE